ncbi:MAG: hypothetical protein Q8R29_00765 [bacterium]|nr:hypothetical protein [bacterium]
MKKQKTTQAQVADEQNGQVTVAEVADQVSAKINEVTEEIGAFLTQQPVVPQFGEATDIPPTPVVPNAPAAEKKHFLSPHTYNLLQSRAGYVEKELRAEIRRGLIGGEIEKDGDFVSHALVMEMIYQHEEKHGFGSAGNPLDQEARNFFRSKTFGGGWVSFRVIGAMLGKEPGDTITLSELEDVLDEMDIHEDGPRVTCSWPGCGKEFQPVSGNVHRNDGTPVTTKEGEPIQFGAFRLSDQNEIIGFCLSCQREARSMAFEEAKKDGAKPIRLNFKSLDEVTRWKEERDDRKRKETEVQDAKSGLLSSVFSGGKVGRIFRDAQAREGKRSGGRHSGNNSRNEKKWR